MDQTTPRILRKYSGARAHLWRIIAWARLVTGFVLAAGVAVGAYAAPGTDVLTHMGVVCLQEEPLASDFGARLAAKGPPVFYISDVVKGVSQGDMIRFRDKAVLVDGDVWQTMMSMGILSRLKNIPVMTLNAQARSEVWRARSDQVSNSKENKGYTLGRELLKIFEDYFGSTPSSRELVVRFDGAYMKLIAPTQLMAELKFAEVVRVQKHAGKPVFITDGPPRPVFVSQPVAWTVWAVDPAEPAGQLVYSCSSEMPPGLIWDGARHGITGTPGTSAPGSWPVTITVKNSGGQAVALSCTLVVVVNTPPRIHAVVDDIVTAGSRWEYAPVLADAEHPLSQLQVRLFNQPPGMTYNSGTNTIVWDVPDTLTDTTIFFELGARDPLGAVSRERVKCRVLSPSLSPQTVTIDFRLPLDTLVQGHLYQWADHVWMKAEWHERKVKLQSIRGDGETAYSRDEESGNGLLAVRPMRHGIHTLTFTFRHDTLDITVVKRCTVIPNRPPVFLSALTSWEFEQNQRAVYRPVVLDEDGDSLRLSTVTADGSALPLKGKSITLPTGTPGLRTLNIVAEDPFGNSASQQIYYSVKSSPHMISQSWYAQVMHRWSMDVGFETRGFRVGLFSADIRKTVTTGFLGLNTYEMPFLFFGGNPLGERQAALGNYLFFDGGLNFRTYGDRFFGGGIVGRIQADYRHQGTSPWRFRMYFVTRLKQALFVADTTGLGEELQYYATGTIDEIYESDLFKSVEELGKVLDSYGKIDNFGLCFQLQTVYRLPAGFWIGPSVILEDDIKATGVVDTTGLSPDAAAAALAAHETGNFLVQHTGLCLMHEWRFRWLEYCQSFHLVWSGKDFSPRVDWNLLLKARRTGREKARKQRAR